MKCVFHIEVRSGAYIKEGLNLPNIKRLSLLVYIHHSSLLCETHIPQIKVSGEWFIFASFCCCYICYIFAMSVSHKSGKGCIFWRQLTFGSCVECVFHIKKWCIFPERLHATCATNVEQSAAEESLVRSIQQIAQLKKYDSVKLCSNKDQ